MNCVLLTVATDLTRPGLADLARSLEKHNWPFRTLKTTWQGFGTKLLTVRDYLLEHPEITHFFFCDAYDVVALGRMDEALSKLDVGRILFSTEKACWPDTTLADKYPECETIYKFLNSGLYFAPRDLFIRLFDWDMPEYITDDQLWATQQFLFNDDSGISLDTECNVFQSYSFVAEDEYGYLKDGGRIGNYNTGTLPVLVHGNGCTDLTKIYELI